MMKENTKIVLQTLVEKYPQLAENKIRVEQAFELLKESFAQGKKLLVCGNGGSACDAEHIVGELLKSFKRHRNIDGSVQEKLLAFGENGVYLSQKLEGALPAISLNSQTGIMTAFANDKAWDATFAQQVYGLGEDGDVLICLSTSGNSQNCVLASLVAKAKGIKTIALTGEGGGKLQQICDCIIAVPERETYKVQELHLPIYHCLCAMLEEEFFGE
jgi:D-sedoheptulose 7-phosphate isomerase